MVNTTDQTKVKILFINPVHDIITYYANLVTNQFIDLISKVEGISITKMEGIMATYPAIQSLMLHNYYDLIVYMGHGQTNYWWDGFLGYFYKDEWVKLFKDTIIYTVSCKTAECYGERFIQYGTKAYIGNNEVVYGAINTQYHDYAKDFARIWQAEMLNLLCGVTVSDSVEFAKMEWFKLRRHYYENWRNGNIPDAKGWGDKALFNGEHHRFLGNGHSRLPKVINDIEQLNIETFIKGDGIFL